jgi:Domain of unknown function (DUF1771)
MHRLPPNMEGHGPPPLPPPPFVVNPNINGGAKAPRFHIRDDRSPSRFDDSGDDFRLRQSSQEDEFPALGSDDRDRGRFDERPSMSRQGSQNIDPSRSRFATAVKKPLPAQNAGGPAPIVVSGAKFVVSPAPGEDMTLSSSPSSVSMIVPKPSPRIKLRPPTLLPTLPTGDALNKLYMTYRERPLQLQAARNACLARAADAWRRNDGASAKRFSRDANELNVKMVSEAKDAAGRLIAERTRILMGEVQTTSRGGGGAGRAVGGGLGVVLGVAGLDAGSAKGDNDEMRTEVAIDLHGLHAAEGVDYLDEFMLSLERERFLGLGTLHLVSISCICSYVFTSVCNCRRGETYRNTRFCERCLQAPSRHRYQGIAVSLRICLERVERHLVCRCADSLLSDSTNFSKALLEPRTFFCGHLRILNPWTIPNQPQTPPNHL